MSDQSFNLTDPVGEYRQYLQSVYQPRVVASYDKLPGVTLSKTTYINLAVIDKISSNNSEVSEMDAFTKTTLHWDIDDIIENKRKVKLEEVGKLEDGTLAKRILVQGAPGVGKTTMALEICRRWKEGNLLAGYSLVVLLRMRDTRMQRANGVEDLLFHYDPKLKKAVTDMVLASKGSGVLFIIEGFDELPEKQQKTSIFSELIKGLILENAAVMVTTRPSASDIAYSMLSPVSVQFIEVVGFTSEQIDQYVGQIITDVALLRTFMNYLSCFPYIRGIMYVPLNCAIVVMVYKYNQVKGSISKTSLPKTQTELYSELTRILLLTYLSEQTDQKVVLPSIGSLPSHLLTQFQMLCEMAYNGIVTNQLIFECLPTGVNKLGLFEAVPDMHDPKATSFNFLHLSLQEYLAAFHISKLSIHKQTCCFDRLVGNQRMSVVLRFLAGLTKFHFHSYEKMGFWSKLVKSRTPADSLRTYIHSQSTFTETIHWIYEAQVAKLARRAFGSKVQSQNLSNVLLSPFDCYTLGYCISRSECMWKLQLQNCNIDSEGISNLAATDGVLARAAVVDLSKNNIGEVGARIGMVICTTVTAL